MAVAPATRERARNDIVRLAHRGLGIAEFSRELTRTLGRAVPFDGTCLLTIDPATILPTSEIVENGLPAEAVGRLTEIELGEPDFNKFAALARGSRPAASLSDVTGGNLDESLRQRELRRPSGFDDELRVVLCDGSGTWGALTLLREAKRPYFSTTEVRFVAGLAATLAEGVRRAARLDAPVDDVDIRDTGLLVLAADNTVEMANQEAGRWLDELGIDATRGKHLPLVVHVVADRARHIASTTDGDRDGADDCLARARVRTLAGRWVVVRASLLGDVPTPRVAVLIEAAQAPELAPLIAAAYGLTERERLVTELVAQGFSTNEIVERLHLSAYTVQDHLKSIFEKSGTGSRGELVARLFFDHYAPRLS